MQAVVFMCRERPKQTEISTASPQNLSVTGFLVCSLVAQSGRSSVKAKEFICFFCMVLSVGFNSLNLGLCLFKIYSSARNKLSGN